MGCIKQTKWSERKSERRGETSHYRGSWCNGGKLEWGRWLEMLQQVSGEIFSFGAIYDISDLYPCCVSCVCYNSRVCVCVCDWHDHVSHMSNLLFSSAGWKWGRTRRTVDVCVRRAVWRADQKTGWMQRGKVMWGENSFRDPPVLATYSSPS